MKKHSKQPFAKPSLGPLRVSSRLVTLGVFLITSLLLLGGAARAATYYVATNGDDSSTGSEAQPFRTIRRGISVLKAGDSLLIKSGIYDENINSNTQTIPSGTSWTNPVTIGAYPSHSVIIQPTSASEVFNLAHSSIRYLIIKGLVIDARNARYCASLTNGANHVRFESCELRNPAWDGVNVGNGSVGGTDYNEFIDLSIHNVGTSGRGHALYIQTNSNLVDRCTIFDNERFGVHIYNGYAGQRANNNIVRNSRFYNNGDPTGLGGGAITVAAGSGNVIYNNLIWDNMRGIDLMWLSPSNCRVFNNTIYRSRGPGIEVGGGVIGIVVTNNIVHRNGGEIINKGEGTILSNNLTTDPMFVAPTSSLALQANSPAINAGRIIADLVTDILGTPRDNSPDIGAIEFTTTNSAAAPPQPSNLRIIQ